MSEPIIATMFLSLERVANLEESYVLPVKSMGLSMTGNWVIKNNSEAAIVLVDELNVCPREEMLIGKELQGGE